MEQKEKRWLGDYKVESEIKLLQGEEKLKYVHPQGLFEVHISNAKADGPQDETLSFRIIVAAPDIEAAEEIARPSLEKFLHLLSFVTSFGFRISRRVHLTDWTSGLVEREQYVYSKRSADEPFDALSSGLLETTRLLHAWGVTPPLERALRWYSAGVRSRFMEDQFQFFWFVIELIAAASGDAEKVTDKCQKCRGDLRCDSCGEISTHRPFPRQRIEKLLLEMGLSESIVHDLFVVRNSLLHGDARESIEISIQAKEPKFTFDKAVDLAGRYAWTAILNTFKKPPGEHRPEFLSVSTYVNWEMTAKAHLRVTAGPDPNNPQIEEDHLPEVSIINSVKNESVSGGKKAES